MSQDIIAVECTGPHCLVLTYEGGERREVEVADIVPFDGVFAPLADADYFRQVRVHPDLGTIVWPNGADLCPDVLYERSRSVAQVGSKSGVRG